MYVKADRNKSYISAIANISLDMIRSEIENLDNFDDLDIRPSIDILAIHTALFYSSNKFKLKPDSVEDDHTSIKYRHIMDNILHIIDDLILRIFSKHTRIVTKSLYPKFSDPHKGLFEFEYN